jgi:hypothetical protein
VSSNQVAYAQKRRSSRIEKAIPLAVQGVDASRAPFREEVTTVAISCHGCSYQMKHEVLPGAMVVLDIGQRANGYSEWPARARVKWIQKFNTATDTAYGIAVEFESAGNIWGLSSPPEDWFPVRGSKVVEPPNPGRELRLITRTEAQTVPARSGGATPVSLLKKSEAAASLSPWFSDLMGGLSNQIQVTVSEIAAVTLANERNRLLDEFRIQLQNEAAGTIERVIETSKEELARRALRVLNEATEATVRASHERLIGAIEQDIENAKRRMLIQGNELNQRADSMATRTIEQLQRTIETSRTEAAARFVSRLREQVAPVLDEAKADLQKLVASQTVFKEESQTIYARVTSELESGVNAKLIQTHDELDKRSSAVLTECNEKLLALSQTFENVARDSIQTLIASATDNTKKNLEERAAEISSNFTGELEGHIRDYLEFISDSIAEFPKKTPVP